MADVMVDTDVLVDHLRGRRRLVTGRDRFSYSVVTRAELFAGHATQEAQVDKLLAPFSEIAVDQSVPGGPAGSDADPGPRWPMPSSRPRRSSTASI